MKTIECVRLISNDTEIHITKYKHNSYPTHRHNFYEFEITLNGNGKQSINNIEYTIARGDMVLLRLTDFHSVNDPAEIYRIQIPISCMPEEIERLLSTKTGNLYAKATEETLCHITALCELLMLACSSNEYDKEYIEQLLSVIIKTFLKLVDPLTAKTTVNSQFLDICLYIQEHFTEDLSLDSLASRFGFSKNYFCAFFKKHTSTTLTEFIKELRLQYAARLIATTKYSSLQIAEMSGYSSYSNYLRDFKKRFGVSPLQMRKIV